MVFVNAGTLGVEPGRRDELVEILVARNDALAEIGCRVYEVGVVDDDPGTVYVVEVWDDAAAHRASLELPEVQAAIATARPMLSGEFGGFRFTSAGSPLRP
ncbi:putative quinol monooxygenase [Microbacterium chocolatum]|uniref:putative quinol monooxygenase n=1 Tax=Microbacterium aurantiacum TaxID=162393 RepID=UPI00338FDD17